MKKLLLIIMTVYAANFAHIQANGLLSKLASGDKTVFSAISVYGQNILNYLQNESTGVESNASYAAIAANSAKELDNNFYTNLNIPDPTTDTTGKYSNGAWTYGYDQTQINAITGGFMNFY